MTDSLLPPRQYFPLHAAVTKRQSQDHSCSRFQADWHMVLGNIELTYVLLCSALLLTTSWFWFHYQTATETLA